MKRKINIDRPKVSADEINQRKDFDSVLKNNAAAGNSPFFKKPWFLSSVIALTAIVVTAVIISNMKESGPKQTVEKQAINEGDSIAREKFYMAEEAKPCIAPPIAGLNIPYTVFKLNAEKGAVLSFKTGSILTVPRNAFTDQQGNPVKGEIELRYREMHDAADFFVSGIPMTYDSAGTRYHFESAGMMEMLAYKDGNPVQMASGKTINVELASGYKGTEYNLYKLDTIVNNWSCLGKDKVVANKDQDNKPGEAEEIKIEKTEEYKKTEEQKKVALVTRENKIAALPKLPAEPKKPLKANKEKYTFNLDLDLTEFPEFAVYKNVQWELGGENKQVNNAMWAELNRIIWEDAVLKEGSRKGENYLLSLKKGSKSVNDLVVYPVFEGKNYEVAMKEFQEKFSSYSVKREKRKEDEKKIEEEYQARIAELKKRQEELEAKWKRERDQELAMMATEEKVMRVFQISSFGVYNCDKPSVYPKGVICSATLTNEKKSKLRCYEVYLVDKSKNGLFTYNRNPVASLSFNPASSNILWTVENGVLHYADSEDMIGLKSGNNVIAMKRVDKKFETVDEMKSFFNL